MRPGTIRSWTAPTACRSPRPARVGPIRWVLAAPVPPCSSGNLEGTHHRSFRRGYGLIQKRDPLPPSDRRRADDCHASGTRATALPRPGEWRLAAAYARSDRRPWTGGCRVAGAHHALPHGCARKGKSGAGMHHRRAPGVDGGDVRVQVVPRTPKLLRSEPLKALVIGAFVRGLSMREVESPGRCPDTPFLPGSRRCSWRCDSPYRPRSRGSSSTSKLACPLRRRAPGNSRRLAGCFSTPSGSFTYMLQKVRLTCRGFFSKSTTATGWGLPSPVSSSRRPGPSPQSPERTYRCTNGRFAFITTSNTSPITTRMGTCRTCGGTATPTSGTCSRSTTPTGTARPSPANSSHRPTPPQLRLDRFSSASTRTNSTSPTSVATGSCRTCGGTATPISGSCSRSTTPTESARSSPASSSHRRPPPLPPPKARTFCLRL
jgi:hypothetical protein